jgi:hypothetical protein
MIVNLKASIDEKRIARIVTNVKKATRPSVLEDIGLSRFAAQALKEFKSHFPESGDPTSSSVREFGEHLIQGWRSEAKFAEFSATLRIYHTKANLTRMQTILESLDTGSKEHTVVPDRDIKFPDKRGTKPWSHLVEGKPVIYPERKGVGYSSKTFDYINSVMVPELKARINKKLKKSIEED